MKTVSGMLLYYPVLTLLEEKPKTRREIYQEMELKGHKIPEQFLRQMQFLGLIECTGRSRQNSLHAGTVRGFEQLDELRELIKGDV